MTKAEKEALWAQDRAMQQLAGLLGPTSPTDGMQAHAAAMYPGNLSAQLAAAMAVSGQAGMLGGMPGGLPRTMSAGALNFLSIPNAAGGLGTGSALGSLPSPLSSGSLTQQPGSRSVPDGSGLDANMLQALLQQQQQQQQVPQGFGHNADAMSALRQLTQEQNALAALGMAQAQHLQQQQQQHQQQQQQLMTQQQQFQQYQQAQQQLAQQQVQQQQQAQQQQQQAAQQQAQFAQQHYHSLQQQQQQQHGLQAFGSLNSSGSSALGSFPALSPTQASNHGWNAMADSAAGPLASFGSSGSLLGTAPSSINTIGSNPGTGGHTSLAGAHSGGPNVAVAAAVVSAFADSSPKHGSAAAAKGVGAPEAAFGAEARMRSALGPPQQQARTPAPAQQQQQQQQAANHMCPLTQKLMLDPVLAFDGITYERSAITDRLAVHDVSPVTGQALGSPAGLASNHPLRMMMANLTHI